MTGPVETDPEYQLIVEANNLTVEIDNEISKCVIIRIPVVHQRCGVGLLFTASKFFPQNPANARIILTALVGFSTLIYFSAFNIIINYK